jgi:hypothetical protein
MKDLSYLTAGDLVHVHTSTGRLIAARAVTSVVNDKICVDGVHFLASGQREPGRKNEKDQGRWEEPYINDSGESMYKKSVPLGLYADSINPAGESLEIMASDRIASSLETFDLVQVEQAFNAVPKDADPRLHINSSGQLIVVYKKTETAVAYEHRVVTLPYLNSLRANAEKERLLAEKKVLEEKMKLLDAKIIAAESV